MGFWDILFRRNVKPGQIYIYNEEVKNPWANDEHKVEVLEVKNGFVKYKYCDLRESLINQNHASISSFLILRTLYKDVEC